MWELVQVSGGHTFDIELRRTQGITAAVSSLIPSHISQPILLALAILLVDIVIPVIPSNTVRSVVPPFTVTMNGQPGTADYTNAISTARQSTFEYMGSWMSNSDQRACFRLAGGEHVTLEELSKICRCKWPHISLDTMVKPNNVVVHYSTAPLLFHCHGKPSC